jgi:hypothetical protein
MSFHIDRKEFDDWVAEGAFDRIWSAYQYAVSGVEPRRARADRTHPAESGPKKVREGETKVKCCGKQLEWEPRENPDKTNMVRETIIVVGPCPACATPSRPHDPDKPLRMALRVLMSRLTERKREDEGCHNCARNVGAGCWATQAHPHDAGYDQPYCDGYERKDERRGEE